MIYISTACLTNSKISSIVEKLAQNDIKYIELSGGTKYYEGIQEDLITLKSRYDLHYCCHAYFPPPPKDFVVNLASCNEEIYKKSIFHYFDCIKLLRKINCKYLSVHAGFYVEISEREIGREFNDVVVYDKIEATERFCFAYDKLAKEAKANGIKMYLENNVINLKNYKKLNNFNYMMMTNQKEIKLLKEKLDFSLLLDLGHLFVSSNTLDLNFNEEIDSLLECIEWVHVSDNNGREDQHLCLSVNGTIFSQVKKIINHKKDINITLETKGELKDILYGYDSMQKV